MANSKHQGYRETFSLKLHRILIVDQSGLMSLDETKDIVQRLEASIFLAISLKGPSRMESLTLGVYRPSQEFSLLLQQVQPQPGNYLKIKTALDDLGSLSGIPEPGSKWTRVFSKLHEFMIESDLYHLSIITEDAIECIEKEFKKIWKPEQFTGISVIRTPCGLEASRKNGVFESDIWDELRIHRYIELENLFKTWLLDPSPIQTEHVRLILPTSIYAKEPLKILCDAHARYLSPLSFPHPIASALLFQTEPLSTSSAPIPKNPKVPLYDLTITSRLPQSGLCQSLLFDITGATLRPTGSFKLEGVARNMDRFKALVRSTALRGEVLLARGEELAHFVLLPGTDSLLVKSLVSKDLLLPFPSLHLDGGEDSEEATEIEIQASLDKVERVDFYDPYDNNSRGLLDSLETLMCKKTKR